MKTSFPVLCMLFSAIFMPPALTQPGSLDETFGNAGITIFPVTPDNEMLYQVAIQNDDKIVAAGFAEINGIQDFLVIRFNADGTPDNGFGTNGIVYFDGNTDFETAVDLCIQSDGKILIGGTVYEQWSTYDDFALVRLNPDGSPDNSFGAGGIVKTDIDGAWDNPYALQLQDDGKILLAGDGYSGSKRNVCIVRYEADGSPDQSFGLAGVALLSIGSIEDRTRSIALQNDGKIIAAGSFNNGADYQAFVARFNDDGSVDQSFANNGLATLDVGGVDNNFMSAAIRPDGKIVIAGHTGDANDLDYLMVRYNSDGTLDGGFGSFGIALSGFGINDLVEEMVLQDDGKFLITGGAFQFKLVRFKENGYPDLDFGENGIVTTSVGSGYSFSHSLARQSNGKIVVAGHTNSGSAYDVALARYHSVDNSYICDHPGAVNAVSIYPNPATSGQVVISYNVPDGQVISLDLFSPDGSHIISFIHNEARAAGTHKENLFLPADLNCGIYFLRISSSGGQSTVKFLVY